MADVRLTPASATELAVDVLVASRTGRDNAAHVADALVAAELAGHRGHGLSRLPSYAAQARHGKVDGHAVPSLDPVAPALVRVDAADGFAYPALAMATEAVAVRARTQGVAVAMVHRSHHVGAAGHHVAAVARAGLVGLLLANTPRAIAPWGAHRPVFGTNPIAFAAPRRDDPPVVVDLSLSRVARGRIMLAAREGRPIDADWAVDAEGRATTDATAAMDGALLPIGDAKGAALALMVELLAAGLGGAQFGFEASSFFDEEGGPPRVGQLLLAIDPGPASAGRFADRIEALVAEILAQDGCHIPGASRVAVAARAARDGLVVPADLHAELVTLAGR